MRLRLTPEIFFSPSKKLSNQERSLQSKISVEDIEQFGQRLYFHQDSALYHGFTEQNWGVMQRMIISKNLNINEIDITNQQKIYDMFVRIFYNQSSKNECANKIPQKSQYPPINNQWPSHPPGSEDQFNFGGGGSGRQNLLYTLLQNANNNSTITETSEEPSRTQVVIGFLRHDSENEKINQSQATVIVAFDRQESTTLLDVLKNCLRRNQACCRFPGTALWMPGIFTYLWKHQERTSSSSNTTVFEQ